MRVAAFVQGFAYGRGRATTALELITPLHTRRENGRQRPHQVDVFVPSSRFVRHTPGVNVATVGDFDGVYGYDVVIYNSGLGEATLDRIRRIRAPKLMCQHSYDTGDPGLRFADAVWYPSNACMRVDRNTGYEKFVVPPPVNPGLYRTRPGRKIGLSLSSHWKGGAIVAQIARALPRRRFLVVKDGRGNGVGLFKGLRNVELVDFMEPRDFYSQCRIQLLPSQSESYGRVGVEGAVSGIPLVASRCPGIREAMQGHGIYLPRNSVGRWVETVDGLMSDPGQWKRASLDVAMRARVIDYEGDQARFCRMVEGVAGKA